MSTRQFIFVLVIAAMIAAGVGLVVGSRPSPAEVPVATAPATKVPATKTATTTTTPPSAAKKPAADVHDDATAAPDTKAIALVQPTTTDVVPHAPEANKALKTADDVPGARTKTEAPSGSNPIASGNAPTNDASMHSSANRPAPTSAPSAKDGSDPVFVTKASFIKTRMAANEGAAIDVLKAINSAEAVLWQAAVIDTDRDGEGEYGYLGELAGVAPCREPTGVKRDKLDPCVLGPAFRKFTSSGNLMVNGYLFRVYLPGATKGGKMPGIAESAGGGCDPKGAQPDHDNCEIRWCCYAWPIEFGVSGTRAFFADQEGDLLVLANKDGGYAGDAHAPTFDAASTKPGDMAEEPVPGGKYTDGRAWNTYVGPEPELPPLVELGPATMDDIAKYNRPDSTEDKVVLPSQLVHPNGAKKPAAGEKMSMSEKPGTPVSITPVNRGAAENVAPNTSTNKPTMPQNDSAPKPLAPAAPSAPATPTPKSAPSATPETEAKVFVNLRTIAAAQSKAQSVAAIDTDKDGQGEYGFFGELAGTSPCRAPAGGKRTLLKPSVLDALWGKVTESGNVVMDGYVYRMYLPATTKGLTPAICEAPGGGCVTSGARPDHDNAENLWTIYAWPLEAGKSGQRAYYMNQSGAILVTPNTDALYTGEQRAPAFDAALVASKAGDMYGAPSNGGMAVDGRVWSALH